MAGFQQLVIVGFVGQPPTFKYTQAGIAVCDFSLAVTRKFGSADERQEKTVWFRVTCWRQLAEIANQYVRKGSQVMVVGTVEARAYTAKDGSVKSSLEVEARELQLLGAREDGSESGKSISEETNTPF